MNQPGPAFSPPGEKDEEAYPFINYLWEAFFLPHHLLTLASLAVGSTMLVLVCLNVNAPFPTGWLIPFLLGGVAIAEWKMLQRWSQQDSFIQAINQKYQAEIRVFRDMQDIPQPTFTQSPDPIAEIQQADH